MANEYSSMWLMTTLLIGGSILLVNGAKQKDGESTFSVTQNPDIIESLQNLTVAVNTLQTQQIQNDFNRQAIVELLLNYNHVQSNVEAMIYSKNEGGLIHVEEFLTEANNTETKCQDIKFNSAVDQVNVVSGCVQLFQVEKCSGKSFVLTESFAKLRDFGSIKSIGTCV